MIDYPDLHVGDRIILKSIDEICEEFSKDPFGRPSLCGLAITDDMYDCFGREAVITKIYRGDRLYSSGNGNRHYYEFSIDTMPETARERHFNCEMIRFSEQACPVEEPDVSLWSALVFA